MRRLCLCLSFLFAALVVAPNANAQGGLNLNQTYRDVIQLSFPTGKTQIPLPEGNWELLGVQEFLNNQDVRMWYFYLARIENDTLVGLVAIFLNHDLWDYGWTAIDFCDRDNLWFKEVKSNRSSDVDCWAVHRVRIRPERWKEGRKQMLDNLLSRNVNVTIPRRMIRAVFYRLTTDNYLRISYYFHRYPLGRPTISREDIKTWGQKWKPKVDAGFWGKLKVFKTKETLAPPAQTPKPGTSRPRSDIKGILRAKGLSDLEAFQEAKNYIGTKCLDNFERSEKRHSSGFETAFAYAQERIDGRYTCGGGYANNVETAKNTALYYCEKGRKKYGITAPCEILAINNKIVWEGETVRSK